MAVIQESPEKKPKRELGKPVLLVEKAQRSLLETGGKITELAAHHSGGRAGLLPRAKLVSQVPLL